MTLEWVSEPGGPRPPQAPPAPQEARPHQVPGRPVCPPGATWDPVAGVCRGAHPQSPPRHLGLTIPQGVQQAHAKGILVVWNSAHPVLGNYGPADAAAPGWSERDGIVLHAFAQWWTGTPKLAWQNDKADSSGVIVAELTPDHLAALDAWLAAQGGQLPGVQVVDVAASKALLVLWGRTDAPVPSGYGLNPAEFASAWSSRDTTELGLFQTWWNAQGKPAVPTGGALDVASSNALKAWFAERAASVPSGWVAPGAQPQTTPAPSPACKAGEVWDAVNKACQPLPTSVVAPGGGGGGGGAGGGAAKSKAVWWVLGGLAAVGAVALVVSSRAVGAGLR